jgi:hypothetical protein
VGTEEHGGYWGPDTNVVIESEKQKEIRRWKRPTLH